jgi:hypothetical protein
VTLHRLGVGAVAFVLLLVLLFAAIMAAGICSAWLEIRRERRAGLVPSRPGWESRAKRRALGVRERSRTLATSLWARGAPFCWCGRGYLVEFPPLDGEAREAVGCAAWEAGDAEAIRRHDVAGGYARVQAGRVP